MRVTTTYLEQTSPADLTPAAVPAEPLEIRRAELPSPEFSRFLYTAVGGDWHWIDRLHWTWRDWSTLLTASGVETWVGYSRGTPAGFVELSARDGAVEIDYFGLLPGFLGRGFGGHLLTEGVRRAWSLADRWPDQPPTTRVWVHTCSLDGPVALTNYTRRGFRPYRTEEHDQDVATEPPGPWPGAGPR